MVFMIFWYTEQRSYTFSEWGSWQGALSYGIFSIYVVQPEAFFNFLGGDPGLFLFCNMLYGQAVHIYTRPAMKKLKTCFRIIYSIYGSYAFNFTSLLIFFAVAESCSVKKPYLCCLFNYLAAEIMYTLFHSYLYFVDVCTSSTSEERIPFYDKMFIEQS